MPGNTEPVPRYLQIAHYYRDQIVNGTLRAGDEIPSERRIAQEWEVARPTAARALLTLRLEGLTESRPGAGTFVADVRPLRHLDGHHRRPRCGEGADEPGEHTEILAAEIVAAPGDIAGELRTDESSRLIRRRRVVIAGDRAVETSTSWFSPDLTEIAPRLLRRSRIREGTLVYIEQAGGRRAEYARDHASARSATAGEQSRLRLEDQPAPVLVVRHVVYDEHDRPLELAEIVHAPGEWAVEREYSLR